MRRLALIWIGIFAGVSGAAQGSADAESGDVASRACTDCSVEFAVRALHLSRSDWRVASIEIREPPKKRRGIPRGFLELSVLFRRAGQGRVLTLSFSPDGLEVEGFRENAAAAPAEDRVYVHEGELLAAVARARPRSLERGCGGYELGFGSAAVVCLDPMSFHVVERVVLGQDAPRALALEMLRALDEDLDIAAVVWFPAPLRRQHRAVKILLSGKASRAIVVGLSRTGEVRQVEVRRARPVAPRAGRSDAERGRLRAWLERANQVVAVDLDNASPTSGQGGALLPVLHGVAGRPFALDLELLVPAHDGCSCPDE